MLKDLYQSALYPAEIRAMLKIKFRGSKFTPTREPLEELVHTLSDRDFCYTALNKVSRSFAMVIQQLPEDLKDAVCVFYLVLRGLDTIEDDMDFPQEKKLPLLRSFHEKCNDRDFKISGVGDQHDYRVLLENYQKVTGLFRELDPQYQQVIIDICDRMGNGMADFSEKKVRTVADYDLYCHYVAGLVGIGLSGLFSASEIEPASLREQSAISNSMGLFLQKTNIIRDYHEDIQSGRIFWPEEIWGKYMDALDKFQHAANSPQALACLNDYVTDALRHVPDCLAYMRMLRNRQVFRFCAIPQVMAIATLAKLYNNPDVFTGVVKIRKGLAAKMMMYTNTLDNLYDAFDQSAREILRKMNSADPNYDLTKQRLQDIFDAIEAFDKDETNPGLFTEKLTEKAS